VDAKEAGVPPTNFSTLQAAILLQDKDVTTAYQLLENEFNDTNLSRSAIQTWVNIFASRGHLEVALDGLQLAANNASTEEDRTQFKIDRAALCRTFGEPHRALLLARELDPTVQNNATLRDRLNQEKISIAERLIPKGDLQDHQTAQEIIDEIQGQMPEEPRIQIARARMLLIQESPDYEQAEALCVKALQYDPQNADAPILLYELSARKGQLDRSLEFANRAVGARPQNKVARVAQVNALIRLQQFPEAATAVEGLLNTYPSDTTILELAAKAYANAGRVRQATPLLDSLETLAGHIPETANTITALRGLLSTYQGNWDEAEALLRAQYEANPTNFASLNTLFRTLLTQGKQQEALEVLQTFANANPQHPEAWTQLGQFYTLQRTKPSLLEAASAFTQALFAMEDYAPALRGLIEVQYSLNYQGVALALCEQYLEDQPDDPGVLYRKALLLSQNPNKLELALTTIEHAATVSEQLEFTTLRGQLLLQLDRYNEAIEDFRHVADIQGITTIQQDIAMATAYIGLEEPGMARRYFELAQSKSDNARIAVIRSLAFLANRLAEIEGTP
jgi:tetratricopeptide (TPR) repeat protein